METKFKTLCELDLAHSSASHQRHHSVTEQTFSQSCDPAAFDGRENFLFTWENPCFELNTGTYSSRKPSLTSSCTALAPPLCTCPKLGGQEETGRFIQSNASRSLVGHHPDTYEKSKFSGPPPLTRPTESETGEGAAISVDKCPPPHTSKKRPSDLICSH